MIDKLVPFVLYLDLALIIRAQCHIPFWFKQTTSDLVRIAIVLEALLANFTLLVRIPNFLHQTP